MIRNMFLYEGEIQLNGWISFDQKFRLNGLVRELVLDEGKKYIPYLDITISNLAPFVTATGEIYMNRDFLGLPNMKDILYFIFDFVIPEDEEVEPLTSEEQFEKDYKETVYNAKESMLHGVSFIIEYMEIGETYGYLALKMADNSRLDLSFGFKGLALKRVDAVISISMGENVEASDRRPRICSGFSARLLADIAIMGKWFWIDYAQNSCRGQFHNPVIAKSGERPLGYGRHNKTTYVHVYEYRKDINYVTMRVNIDS